LAVAAGLLLLLLPAGALAKTVRVGVVPFSLHSNQEIGYLVQGVRDMLSSRLASPETELVDPAEVEAALKDLPKPLTASAAAQAAKRLKADYLVFGSLTKLGNQYSLNWQILKADGGGQPTGLARTATEDDLIPVIDEMSSLAKEIVSGRPPSALVARPGSAQPAETQAAPPAKAPADKTQPAKEKTETGPTLARTAQPEQPQPRSGAILQSQQMGQAVFESIPVDPRPLAMAVGDVNGDKTDEVLLISEKELLIYGFQGSQPVLLSRINRPLPGRLFLVSAGDLDKDGKAEIALTSLNGALPTSAIFRFDGKNLHQVAGLARHHLRIISSPQGPILVAQEATLSNVFSGGFIQYALSGSSLIRSGGITGAGLIEFSTLGLANLTGAGQAESVGLSGTEKLTVVSPGGAVLFRSGDTYGGTNNTFQLPAPNPTDDQINFSINAAVQVADVDGSGKPTLLVVLNNDTARRISVNLSHYRRGSVFGLTWLGHSVAQTWRTPNVEEYVAGTGVVRLANGDRLLVMAGTEPEFYGGTFSLWKKTKGYLFKASLTVEKSKQ
jgi:TolB-like protein